jgi:preprotein translocase subunit SecF
MIEIFHNPSYNFINRRKWAYLLSTVLVLIGLASLAIQGLQYDIDFTGGTLVQVRFEKPPSVAAIRAGLTRINLGDAIIQEFGDPREFIVRIPLAHGVAAEELGKRVEAALGWARRRRSASSRCGAWNSSVRRWARSSSCRPSTRCW